MDVFALHQRLITDYAAYIQSFTHISHLRIAATVGQELETGLRLPEFLIQLIPAFAPGDWIADLANDGTLQHLCSQIFQIKAPGQIDKPPPLHRHQPEGIRPAKAGDDYVLPPGTGDGKNLAHIISIVDAVLRRGIGKVIQVIIVYSMNALANDQLNESGMFLSEEFAQEQPSVTCPCSERSPIACVT